jgi:hypothetical protein
MTIWNNNLNYGGATPAWAKLEIKIDAAAKTPNQSAVFTGKFTGRLPVSLKTHA